MHTNINSNSCRICFDPSQTIASLADIVDGYSLADMLRQCVNLEVGYGGINAISIINKKLTSKYTFIRLTKMMDCRTNVVPNVSQIWL